MNVLGFCISGVLLLSCSSGFKKGGYYYTKENDNFIDNQSYYANDKKRVYIQFSQKYMYRKENFNAEVLTKKDTVILQEFKINPSRKLLFSYHSLGRDVIAMFASRSFPKRQNFKWVTASNGKSFLYRSEKTDSAQMIDNLYPFGRKFIRIIEKTKTTPDPQTKNFSPKQEVYLFPEITSQKPF